VVVRDFGQCINAANHHHHRLASPRMRVEHEVNQPHVVVRMLCAQGHTVASIKRHGSTTSFGLEKCEAMQATHVTGSGVRGAFSFGGNATLHSVSSWLLCV
jgi:hypothetical protein